MVSFIFAWMGSFVFWCVVIPLWLTGGLLILRFISKEAYNWIVLGEPSNSITVEGDLVAMILLAFLFWPVILLVKVFLKLVNIICVLILKRAFRAFFKAIHDVTNYEIKKR